MEYLAAPFEVSRIALGTWAIGGWMWGGTNEDELIQTIHAALDRGIKLIDTAPVYGFGRSEEIVGRALAQGGRRKQAIIATKVGLAWKDGQPYRNASKKRILQEVEDRCGVCKRTSLTSTRSIGRTPTRRWRKPRKQWRLFIVPAKSGRSA